MPENYALTPTSDPEHPVVVLDYNKLVDENTDFTEAIETAYGFNGLGLLVVKNVPDVAQARQRLLPLIHKFANLPDEIKNKVVHKESHFNFGWSHGVELLEGKPDLSKGSYYANPQYDVPFDDPELVKKYPPFCHPNIWPEEDLPELQGAFKGMGQIIVKVGILIAKHCDKFIKARCSAYPDNKILHIIETSRTCKGRLLHYFPLNEDQLKTGDTADISTWCGWHNDHGSLTGLTCAGYFDQSGNDVPNPDPKSGLYIRSRSGAVIQVKMPTDCLAFQIGETAQIHSGGLLQATPHAVRGCYGAQSAGISRDTMAVFMEPEWPEKMNIPQGTNADDVTRGSATQYLPKGVPQLATRWNADMDFGQFTDATLNAYH